MMTMKLLSLLLPALLFLPGKEYKIAFGSAAGRTADWAILSDNVMGGKSEATIAYLNTAVMVKGTVSLKNRGGFVSIKSPWGTKDLSSFKTVKITFKSTGQQYAFTLENSYRWYEPAYKHHFSASQVDTWETVSLNLDDFTEERIGNPTGNKVSKSILENILRLGISTDEKREGPFQLEIASIEFL
jgi:NADH dehydrogenase [ubiquinone] 1 alpha subcomplex assembly factor 1